MKKREIKPFVDTKKKLVIGKLSFLTGLSIKEISEDLCNHAIDSNFAIKLAPHIKHSIKMKMIQLPAMANPIPLKNITEEKSRMSLMLSPHIYEYAHSLSFAVESTTPKIIANMIEFSMDDTKYFNHYVSEYLSSKIDSERKELLKSILNEINGNFEEEYTVAALLFYIADEIKEIDESLENSVETLVSQWT